MISLAITTYNRSGFVVESFIDVLDNDMISEILIVDDNSCENILNNLKAILDKINHPKVNLIINESNLGVFANKNNAAKLCKNDWIIMLDSDNVISNDYIDKIVSFDWDEDVLYCPEILYDPTRTNKQWSYTELINIYIDKSNVKDYIEDINFETCLNTGNNFFNRRARLDALNLIDELGDTICSAESTYMSYLWLLSGKRIKVVSGLSYVHRQHSGSWYLNHIQEGIDMNFNVYQKIPFCPF